MTKRPALGFEWPIMSFFVSGTLMNASIDHRKQRKHERTLPFEVEVCAQALLNRSFIN